MINLLPKEDRINLWREYRRRLLVTWSGVLCAVLASALILEASFYLVLWYKRQAVEHGLAQVTVDAKPAQFDELEKALSETGKQVAVLLTPREALPLSTLIAAVVAEEERVSGVSLGDMTFDFSTGAGLPAGQAGTLSLRGVAATRQNFLDFVKTLSANEHIETVDYPVNNLISDRNIRFALNIAL